MAQPRHADAIADGEFRDARPKRRHMADDLMAEHERELGLRQLAVEDVQIGAADAAGRDLDEDLAGPRLGHSELGGLSGVPARSSSIACISRGDGHASLRSSVWTLR